MKYALCFPFLILLLSINLIVWDQNFYEKEMLNYETYEREVQNLKAFFIWGELEEENYSEREIIHLKDVRRLIWLSIILLILFTIPCIISLLKDTKEHIRKECFKGGIYSLIILVGISLVLLSFSHTFILFHKILFTNDYWLLPADALLIQMFPEEFFIRSTKQILLYSAIFSLLSILIGIFARGKKHDSKRT